MKSNFNFRAFRACLEGFNSNLVWA